MNRQFLVNPLELADELEAGHSELTFFAAAELRKLRTENETLRTELLEQARLNGMGSEREARLRSENEVLQRTVAARDDEIQTHSAAVYEATRLLTEARDEKEALREAAQQALEAMEAADVDPHSSDAIYKAGIALRAALAENYCDTALLRQALAQLEINRTNFRNGPSKSICKMLAGGNDEVIAALRERLGEVHDE